MNVIKWNPFRELEDMQMRLNRMLNETSARPDEPFAFADWAPAVDIQETDAAYSVKADLPEVKKEDIKIELHDGVLSIEGERRKEKEEKGKKFHRIERQYRPIRPAIRPAERGGCREGESGVQGRRAER